MPTWITKENKKIGQIIPCTINILYHFNIKHSFTYPKTWGKESKRLKKTKNDYFSSALALLPANLDHRVK